MEKARLLQAVCTVAVLAAAPAVAQTDTAPASKMGSPDGSNSSSAMSTHSSHRSGMGSRSTGMMHSKADSAGDAAVDQLNDQSYQAAQRGEAFNASNVG